jgi:hypothetical protein
MHQSEFQFSEPTDILKVKLITKQGVLLIEVAVYRLISID